MLILICPNICISITDTGIIIVISKYKSKELILLTQKAHTNIGIVMTNTWTEEEENYIDYAFC